VNVCLSQFILLDPLTNELTKVCGIYTNISVSCGWILFTRTLLARFRALLSPSLKGGGHQECEEKEDEIQCDTIWSSERITKVRRDVEEDKGKLWQMNIRPLDRET